MHGLPSGLEEPRLPSSPSLQNEPSGKPHLAIEGDLWKLSPSYHFNGHQNDIMTDQHYNGPAALMFIWWLTIREALFYHLKVFLIIWRQMTTIIQSKLETIGWKIAILMPILRRIAVGPHMRTQAWLATLEAACMHCGPQCQLDCDHSFMHSFIHSTHFFHIFLPILMLFMLSFSYAFVDLPFIHLFCSPALSFIHSHIHSSNKYFLNISMHSSY